MCHDAGRTKKVLWQALHTVLPLTVVCAVLGISLSACSLDTSAAASEEGQRLALVEDSARVATASPTTSIASTTVSSTTTPSTIAPSTASAEQDEGFLSSDDALVRTWPMEFPLPRSARVTNSKRVRDGDYFRYTVDFSSPLSFEEVVGHFAVLTDGLFVEHEQLSGEPGELLLNRRLSSGPNLSITVVLIENFVGSTGAITITVYRS